MHAHCTYIEIIRLVYGMPGWRAWLDGQSVSLFDWISIAKFFLWAYLSVYVIEPAAFRHDIFTFIFIDFSLLITKSLFIFIFQCKFLPEFSSCACYTVPEFMNSKRIGVSIQHYRATIGNFNNYKL